MIGLSRPLTNIASVKKFTVFWSVCPREFYALQLQKEDKKGLLLPSVDIFPYKFTFASFQLYTGIIAVLSEYGVEVFS
jgi:hypothetical protein